LLARCLSHFRRFTAGEWDVPDEGPDAERRFVYIIAHDRDLVINSEPAVFFHGTEWNGTEGNAG
jgi:hypothetical protein